MKKGICFKISISLCKKDLTLTRTIKSIMENKYTIVCLSSIIYICLFLVSCKDETPCNRQIIENNLDAYQRSRCPHTGSDTLVFISNKGDTVSCFGTGEKRGVIAYSQGPIDCPTSVRDEQVYLEYFSNKPTFSQMLTIMLRAGTETLIIIINGKEYVTYFPIIQEYKYTFQINTDKGIKPCISIGDSIYYNHQDGIVKYIQNDSTIWNRKL